MKIRTIAGMTLAAVGLYVGMTHLAAQITGTIVGGSKPRIAIPDFRGNGAAAQFMATFNETVWNDIADSGAVDMVAKTNYPLQVPQAPTDLKPPTVIGGTQVKQGMWFTDWSSPPVATNYLGIGNVDVNGGNMILRGWLYNAGLADVQTAQYFGNTYFGPLTQDGARKIAHEYAADILKQLGAQSLAGSKIYFVSDRTGQQEIWSMDYDGQNQQRMTSHRSISKMPAVSPDGKMVAYATMANSAWQLRVINTETRRQMAFVSPATSTIATPEFTPDGSHLWFSMVINESPLQIVATNLDGGNRQRISNTRSIEISPRINPKTGKEVLFISGRTGHPQLYKMNIDGSGAEMVTTGEGDVANPSWSPDGKLITFAWTRGYDPGNFNIFVMDVATKKFVQLTRQNGSNENPFWAPDGVHLVYANQRGRNRQIFTMLADGTRVKQLTTEGDNQQPVWTKSTN